MSSTNKSKQNPQNTNFTNLAVLLRHFVGLELTVELKNGRIYRGQLYEADDYMNLIIKNVNVNHASTRTSTSIDHHDDILNTVTADSSNPLESIDYQMIHIRGASIRYVHFPDNADLPKLVKQGLDRVKAASDKYARGKRNRRSSTT